MGRRLGDDDPAAHLGQTELGERHAAQAHPGARRRRSPEQAEAQRERRRLVRVGADQGGQAPGRQHGRRCAVDEVDRVGRR